MPAPASEDDLKRRARRRLIGAVALTLAAVIVLPLLLEDEPPPAARLEVHMPPVAESLKAPDAIFVSPITPLAQAPEPPDTSAPVVAEPPANEPTENPKPVLQPELKKSPKPNPLAKTESKPATETPSAFVVQLGAFSDAAKTAALQRQADDLGLSSYTDKSGALTRLRVGPFTSRQAAMEAAAQLAEAGVSGQVMPK